MSASVEWCEVGEAAGVAELSPGRFAGRQFAGGKKKRSCRDIPVKQFPLKSVLILRTGRRLLPWRRA